MALRVLDPKALIDALSPALGLTIDPAYRAGVAGFLNVAAQMADIVAQAPVGDTHFEMAAVFRPGGSDPVQGAASLPPASQCLGGQTASKGPAHTISQDLKTGARTALAVTEAALADIEVQNPRLRAFTDVTAARALAQAVSLDAKRAAGGVLGPLAGVPFAVKNLTDIAGLPTRAGSKINRTHPPATQDSVLVQRLTAADAILLGALNMGEYAYDFTGENAHDGDCANPHDPTRMSGGSSSGSAAAVAAGLVPVALGSDTNGSIRVPSSLCGVFGLKPTYGRLPRTGTFPFCDSLDHLGLIARDVGDLALVYDVLQGFHAGDPACAPRPVRPTMPDLARGTAGLRIAIAGGYFNTDGLPEAAAAVAQVASILGARSVLEIDGAAEARAAAFLITNAESAAFHLPRLRAQAADFDPDTRDRFLAGAHVPAAWLVQAQRVRRWFHDALLRMFEDVDLLIVPATPCVAPVRSQKTMLFRGADILVRPNLGLFTQPFSCVGFPVVTVPTHVAAMPIGVQVVAAPWREDLCLQAAFVLQEQGCIAVTP